MKELTVPPPVCLFIGILSADEEAVRAILSALAAGCGPSVLEAGPFPFDVYTSYYRAEMGTSLTRRFIAFRRLIRRERLVRVKLFTRELERRHAVEGKRRVNLDPGYLDPARVVLATGKDFSHRLYLGRGVYGEVTLRLHRESIESFPWTYPDYRSEPATEFFLALRRILLAGRREDAAGRENLVPGREKEL